MEEKHKAIKPSARKRPSRVHCAFLPVEALPGSAHSIALQILKDATEAGAC
jgi:hypothetical protein